VIKRRVCARNALGSVERELVQEEEEEEEEEIRRIEGKQRR
jgi:hypothetical protein